MWIGDSLTEIGGANPCTVSAGAAFVCEDPDDGSSFAGSIDVSAGVLTLELGECGASPSECRATYVRDPAVICP